MGRRHPNPPGPPAPGGPQPSGEIIIQSDLAADLRTYITTVQTGHDTIRTLTPTDCLAWATTVLCAAMQAEHDALVLRQLTGPLGMPLKLAVTVIADLRADRPPLDDATTSPLHLEPGVNTAREPFLAVHLGGKRVGQWTCEDARSHAQGILEVMAAVDLDAAFYRYLTGTLNLEPDQARAMVATLRPESDQP
jgi:hypothetical protein